jgi:hypothetical protein
VISNYVYKILGYVLNTRMVSIEIVVYVLISVRLMVAIKGGCITSADRYFGDQCVDSCPIYFTICLQSKWTMQCL